MAKHATKPAPAQGNVVNGVNVTQMFETIDKIKQTPMISKFRFRVQNEWLDGGHNRSTIKGFYGAGEEDKTRMKPFVYDCDEPPILLGEDRGANPVEYLLHALAGCVTTSIVYHAAAKGIAIEEVESRVEGDIDLRGFLGLSEEVPRGYQGIRMSFKIKADVPDDTLEEFVAAAHKLSPVFDTITRAVPVTVQLEH